MTRFDDFIRERRYLRNVSPATVSWYTHAFKWLPSESPTQAQLKDVVLRMREKGLKETGCNAAIRAINAYLHWVSGADRKCGPGCSHPRISQLKEPHNLLPTLSQAQIKLILGWKPNSRNFYQRRLHFLALFLLDTGCRISEALAVRVTDIDYDNLVVTFQGKGRKQRLAPFSVVLRKVLHRFTTDFPRTGDQLLFCTRHGVRVRRMTALREMKWLCKELGFEAPKRTLHAFRHTFAVNYVRNGGSVFHLQKALGHSSLEMTKRYVSLSIEDLRIKHQEISLLILR